MNARRCTLLLAIASSLVLASCAIKQPPYGADIMPESARAKIPGSWAGPHHSGTVVPNWIRNFGDPELTALVADAVERNPDLKAAAARVEASRAAVRIAASSLYPRIAMKGLGERQGQDLGGDIGRDINPPSFGSGGTEDSGGAGSTPARINHRSAGYMASQPVPHGRRTCGGGFARKKLPRKLKAMRWKPTTNLPGNHSPLYYVSTYNKTHKKTKMKLQTEDTQSGGTDRDCRGVKGAQGSPGVRTSSESSGQPAATRSSE